jgi:MHS family proline/betaine transporter-like MFS transporter
MHLLRFVRVILPALIGNVLEWYEFAIYGYFAVDIAHQFFPEQDRSSGLIQIFAVFAIGFIMRPVGAIVFGYFADRLGRKKILPISIIMMAVATMAVGLIPTHGQIGIWAGLLLVLFRIIQGVAVGGEYSSSIAYVIEQTPKPKRGFFGSLTLFGAYFGILLGSAVCASISYLAKDTPYFEYAWRGAFLLGILLGLLGLYIRKNMPESPEFIEAKRKNKLLKNPLKDLIRNHPRTIFLGVGMTLLPAVSSWTIMGYFPTFTSQYGKVAEYQVLTLATCTLLVTLAAIPIFGYLSDRFGRFPFLLASPIFLFLFSYFLFKPLLSSSLMVIFLAQAALAVMYIMSEAVIPATLASIFPVNQRCTGIAISVNISNGFFGGTAPLVATFLIKETGRIFAPSWYIMFIALISLGAAIATHKYFHRTVTL